MRHRKKGKILDRKLGPRKALLRSLALNLILKEKIKTTQAKAKAVRPLVEHLITIGRKNDLNSRRRIHAFLGSRLATKKILEEISPRYNERLGGYLRIIKIGPRKGDAAPIVILELV